MSYFQYATGLYLLKQKSEAKSVIEHYGILDVGNRFQYPLIACSYPIVIHQTPPSIKIDWLQNTGEWIVLGRITDEREALMRMREAFNNPDYDLFGNNCEHFARYVATGRRESKQLQVAGVVAGLAAMVLISAR